MWSNPRSLRRPSNWSSRVAPRILRRDSYRCRLSLPGICIGRATEVDHIDGTDDHRDANLQAVCGPCHRVKTSAQARAAIAAKQARGLRPAEPHPGSV